jgi:predicted nucleic acid-binding protein
VTIYADTSYLVARLYPGDLHHAQAKRFFSRHAAATWVTSSWSQFETVNALRQLCLHRPGPDKALIEAIRLLFKHWHKNGPFQLERLDLEEALNDCRKISAAFGASLRMRTADTLHVALLEQIQPADFVTRDRDQFDLAQRRGFKCHLVP